MPQFGRFRSIAERSILRTINPQSFSGLIEVPANTTYVVVAALSSPARIKTLRVKTSAGTLTINARIGGVSITGLAAAAVTAVIATFTATGANGTNFADTNAQLDFIVSANAAGANLAFTFSYDEG